MEISEVRIKLISNPTDRLKAFASVTLDDDFVVRDIKIIDGTSGVFVAMPSRKLADRCPNCSSKNHMRAKYCNECGKSLGTDRGPRDRRGRTKLHADIAHPINSECRQQLQQRIVEAYKQELERAAEPGYSPLSDDEYEDTGLDHAEDVAGGATEDTAVDPVAQDGDVVDKVAQDDDVVDEIAEDDDVVDEVAEDDDATETRAPDDSGGYDALIADLRRDAADRSESRKRPPDDHAKLKRERVAPQRKHQKPEKVAVPAAGALEEETVESERPDPTSGDSAPADEFGAGIV